MWIAIGKPVDSAISVTEPAIFGSGGRIAGNAKETDPLWVARHKIRPMVSVLAAALLLSIDRFRVLPSDTDPSIHQFDVPHTIYYDPAVTQRNELLVFLPGTNGRTAGINGFCSTAAELGYQVVNLMYPDDTAAATVAYDPDPDAFLDFRLAIIEGSPNSKHIYVDRANSIENRLIKLLQYLDGKQPEGHWGKYLTSDGNLDWPHIAVSGLSQGAGHAALIAIRHQVARAVLFGGPKDYSRVTYKPAAWYTPPATPLNLIFTFNHERDRQACVFKEQLEICHTMGLDQFGPPVDVDTAMPPFGNSHVLYTNYPMTPPTSVRFHTSVVADASTPKAPDGSAVFQPVWVYMLTAGGS